MIEDSPGNVFGGFFFNTGFIYTNESQSGELTITHLDFNLQVVSGTFFFDVIDQNGALRQIREGRFDMQFTQ